MDWLSRQFSTRVIVLMPIAIAINIVLGYTVQTVLNLPIYLDSIGTILVGVLAGPVAGALTGILSNFIWQYAPVHRRPTATSARSPSRRRDRAAGRPVGLCSASFARKTASGLRHLGPGRGGDRDHRRARMADLHHPGYGDPSIGGYPSPGSTPRSPSSAWPQPPSVGPGGHCFRMTRPGVGRRRGRPDRRSSPPSFRPRSAAYVFEGVTGSGTDLIVAALRKGGSRRLLARPLARACSATRSTRPSRVSSSSWSWSASPPDSWPASHSGTASSSRTPRDPTPAAAAPGAAARLDGRTRRHGLLPASWDAPPRAVTAA